MRWSGCLVAVALVGGCDTVFDFDRVPDAAIDAPPDAPPPPPHCSPMSMLADDFTAGDFLLWPGHDTIAAIGGRAVFDTSRQYQGLGSEYFYDLEDSAIAVDIAITGTMVTNDYVALELTGRYGQLLMLGVDGTDLVARIYNDNNPADELVRVTYDPAQHARLRVARVGATLEFSVAPPGGPFTLIASGPSPAWVTYVRASVQVARNAGSTFGVAVDNVNGGTPMGAPCHVQYLQDDFEGSMLGVPWIRSTPYSGTLVQAGGVVTLTPEVSQVASITLLASALQDVRGGRFSVEIPQMVDTQSTAQRLSMFVATLDNKTVTLSQENGTLRWTKTGDVQVGSIPYDPVAHRWWQIREDAGLVSWEVSADGRTYAPLGTMPSIPGLDRTSLGIQVQENTAQPKAAILDNVNTTPPP
ncbi:MAG: hypothetical protein IPQ07_08810 [Myxococcales bacterium]|nr:hypothetical protein [Myxococcales bacterium]